MLRSFKKLWQTGLDANRRENMEVVQDDSLVLSLVIECVGTGVIH